MKKADSMAESADPFNLERFLSAQSSAYGPALAELRSGRKRTHWMWFVFPQFEGLGQSATSRHFAIKSLEEARAYLNHPVLGSRLRECAEAVRAVEGQTASDIFGFPDDLKLRSSMTLFAAVAEPESVFERVLEKYFQGKHDERTLQLLKLQR
jgi:uncharacterized protein (DUF1810 family)